MSPVHGARRRVEGAAMRGEVVGETQKRTNTTASRRQLLRRSERRGAHESKSEGHEAEHCDICDWL